MVGKKTEFVIIIKIHLPSMYLSLLFAQQVEHECFRFVSVSDWLLKAFLLKETPKLIRFLNLY